jgi:hypothetical protein
MIQMTALHAKGALYGTARGYGDSGNPEPHAESAERRY